MTPGTPSAESVLIVDDDKLVRMLLAEISTSAGFTPLLAASPDEARAFYPQNPRLALIDYTLEGATGDELCREIRLNDNTWSMPVVMVTALDEPQMVKRCLVNGADDFIPKPVEAHELVAKLNAVRGGGEPGFARRLESRRVLFATKNPLYTLNLKHVLMNCGCAVDVANNAAEATKAMSGAQRPDIAVLDIDLLGPDDTELIRHIEPPGRAATTVLVIASAKTMAQAGAGWKTPRLWNLLAPFDGDEDRDDVLRHIGRALTVGAFKASTRRKVRVPFYSVVRFRWQDDPKWMHGIGFDLSESGIFIRTLTPLRPARRSAELAFRMGTETVTLQGTIIWSNVYGPRHVVTLPFGMGISFTDAPESAVALIQNYVRRKLDEPPRGPPPSPAS